MELLRAAPTFAEITCVACEVLVGGKDLARHVQEHRLRPGFTKPYSESILSLLWFVPPNMVRRYRLPCPWCSFLGDLGGHINSVHREKLPQPTKPKPASKRKSNSTRRSDPPKRQATKARTARPRQIVTMSPTPKTPDPSVQRLLKAIETNILKRPPR